MSGGNTGGALRDATAAFAAGAAAPPAGVAVATFAIGAAAPPDAPHGSLLHDGHRLPTPAGTSAPQWLHSLTATTAPERSRSRIGWVMRLISSRVIGPRRKLSAHRVWNSFGSPWLMLCSRKMRLPSDAITFSRYPRSVKVPYSAATLSRPSRRRALSRSVCSLPTNHVPAFDSAL